MIHDGVSTRYLGSHLASRWHCDPFREDIKHCHGNPFGSTQQSWTPGGVTERWWAAVVTSCGRASAAACLLSAEAAVAAGDLLGQSPRAAGGWTMSRGRLSGRGGRRLGTSGPEAPRDARARTRTRLDR